LCSPKDNTPSRRSTSSAKNYQVILMLSIEMIIQSKRLLLSKTESVLMPRRKQLGYLKARKADGIGMLVVQFRGLAASLRSQSSREGFDIKSGNLKLLDAECAWGTRRESWESIIQREHSS